MIFYFNFMLCGKDISVVVPQETISFMSMRGGQPAL